jgi:hypothetical protein
LSESTQHTELVRLAETWMRAMFRDYARALITLCDLPERASGDKPPAIGGFVPDLYASTFPAEVTIIGEAKCSDDLITRRSGLQIRAFLDHLRFQSRGHFVIAVERRQEPIARRLVRLAAQEVGADGLRLFSLTPLGGATRIDAAR